MVMRIGGGRRKTRSIMRKPRRQRGKISLRAFFQELAAGELVVLKAEPSIQTGTYFRRFHGKVARVSRRLGSCYEVVLMDRGKEKQLIVHGVHLKKLQQGA
jgi:large subunit ribosomal protein L21e